MTTNLFRFEDCKQSMFKLFRFLMIGVAVLCPAQSKPLPVSSAPNNAHPSAHPESTISSAELPTAFANDLTAITKARDAWSAANTQFESEFWDKYNFTLSGAPRAKDAFCSNAQTYQQWINLLCTSSPQSECKTGLLQQWIDAKKAYYEDELALVQKNRLHVDSLLADADREENDCLDLLDSAQKQLSKHQEEKHRLSNESSKTPRDAALTNALAKLDEIIETDKASVKYITSCKNDIANQRENLKKMIADSAQRIKLCREQELWVDAQRDYYRTHYSMLWILVLEICPERNF